MMTEQQKKMKKYTNAIERRLNLPPEVKERVMSDLISSIEARRESGMTDEEIYEELGTPKKVAAELNEQMKEFAYRKSPWRFLFAASAFLCGVWIVLSRILQYCGLFLEHMTMQIYPNEAASIGVIGGADGPTSIFVTRSNGFDWDVAIMAAALVISVVAYLRLRKCKQK